MVLTKGRSPFGSVSALNRIPASRKLKIKRWNVDVCLSKDIKKQVNKKLPLNW